MIYLIFILRSLYDFYVAKEKDPMTPSRSTRMDLMTMGKITVFPQLHGLLLFVDVLLTMTRFTSLIGTATSPLMTHSKHNGLALSDSTFVRLKVRSYCGLRSIYWLIIVDYMLLSTVMHWRY